MALLRGKSEHLVAALVPAVLTAGAVIAWDNHRFNHLERMLGEKPAAAFVEPGALDPVREAVKAGIKEFLQESAAKAGGTGQRRGAENEVVEAPAVTELDHVLGRPDAPVTMLVYTDIECPYSHDDRAGNTGEVPGQREDRVPAHALAVSRARRRRCGGDGRVRSQEQGRRGVLCLHGCGVCVDQRERQGVRRPNATGDRCVA